MVASEFRIIGHIYDKVYGINWVEENVNQATHYSDVKLSNF